MSRIETCICGEACSPTIYIGYERIPLCQECYYQFSDSDIETDKDISRDELISLMKGK